MAEQNEDKRTLSDMAKQKLASRKFILTIMTFAVNFWLYLEKGYAQELFVRNMIVILAVYVIGESVVDSGILGKAKIEALLDVLFGIAMRDVKSDPEGGNESDGGGDGEE